MAYLSEDEAALPVSEIIGIIGLLYLVVLGVLIALAPLAASAMDATEFIDWTLVSGFTA